MQSELRENRIGKAAAVGADETEVAPPLSDPRANMLGDHQSQTVPHPLSKSDFKSARIAIPHPQGMRPSGLFAFQWSGHTQAEPGARGNIVRS